MQRRSTLYSLVSGSHIHRIIRRRAVSSPMDGADTLNGYPPTRNKPTYRIPTHHHRPYFPHIGFTLRYTLTDSDENKKWDFYSNAIFFVIPLNHSQGKLKLGGCGVEYHNVPYGELWKVRYSAMQLRRVPESNLGCPASSWKEWHLILSRGGFIISSRTTMIKQILHCPAVEATKGVVRWWLGRWRCDYFPTYFPSCFPIPTRLGDLKM